MDVAETSIEKTLTPPRNCVVHSWLSSAVYQHLKDEAAHLGMHPDRLSAEILNSVLQNGLTLTLLASLRPHR